MSNVGSNENNLSDFNTTDVDFLFADTDLQALFDNDFELENVPPANVPSNPVRSVQSMPVQFNSLRWRPEYHPLLEGTELQGVVLIRRWSFVKLVKNTIF
jgi:hypothetical protein